MVDICWATSNKRLVFAWRSAKCEDWRDRSVADTVIEFEKWDAKMRKEFGLWRTVRLFPRHYDSGGRKTIASLHWPHRNCWSWFIECSKVHDECRGLKVIYGYRQFALVFWWGQIDLHWQNNMTSVASQYRDDAPEIILKCDIERALYKKRMSAARSVNREE